MNSRDLEDDLDLLALAYVNAELDEQATQSFEARLAEDQATREAVERAVLLGSAAVREPLTSATAIASAHRFGWRSVAALVVAAVGLGVYLTGGFSGDGGPAATDAEAQSLIASWVELGDLTTDPELGFDEDDVDADVVVPGWLMEAVEEDKDR